MATWANLRTLTKCIKTILSHVHYLFSYYYLPKRERKLHSYSTDSIYEALFREGIYNIHHFIWQFVVSPQLLKVNNMYRFEEIFDDLIKKSYSDKETFVRENYINKVAFPDYLAVSIPDCKETYDKLKSTFIYLQFVISEVTYGGSGTRILLIQPKEKPFSDHKRKAVEFISKQLNLYFYSKLKPNRIHYEGSNYLCDRLSLHSLKLGIMMLGNRDFKDITGFDGFKTMCDSFDRT